MKYILNLTKLWLLGLAVICISCDDDDDDNGNGSGDVEAPSTYTFERDGKSTVSYGGQSTRIAMAEEIIDALKDDNFTEAQIDAMFTHKEGDNDFSDTDLNASGKNVRGKVAASTDYFVNDASAAAEVKVDFDDWIAEQVTDVYPNWNQSALAGTAGQFADGSSTRYVNSKGVEVDQVFTKSLIGGLMLDQIVNNYVSSARLDKLEEDNDAGVLDGDDNFTEMEHNWDEAFGYLYGAEVDAADPKLGVDGFLNKYLARVERDTDFAGIADDVYNAFIKGRAAIVAKNYTVRNEQAEILREKLSLVIGVRAVYYLQQGKAALEANTSNPELAFHDFSEGLGFLYSLQFTRKPGTDGPYFTRTESIAFVEKVLEGTNGLWDVNTTDLDDISDDIATAFGFTVAQAGS